MKMLGLIIVWFTLTGIRATAQRPSAPVEAPDDFQARCHSKGVVRCFGFDSPNEVLSQLRPAADNRIHALVDSSVKASGAASLRFDIFPRLGANSSGSLPVDFGHDFGSGEEFYVQWRQRFDREMVTHVYRHGEGWKQAIIGGDGRPLASAGSCTPNEVVVQNSYHRGFPQIYHSCGLKDSQYEPLNPMVPPSDFLLQDGVGCRYSNQKGPQCFRYLPDQWMTFQVHIKIGKWYVNQSGNYHRDSTVELWVAEENKPSVLVISIPDYDLVHDGADQKYSRIWLLPYNTNKDDTEDHPVAHTWYDELIVSRSRIPDPGVKTPNAPDSLSGSATAQGVELRWRANSDTETGFLIERCAGDLYECEGSQAFSPIATAPAHSSSFIDKSTVKARRYTYRVCAKNKAGNSAFTNPAANIPGPPSDLVAQASGTGVDLSWTSSSQGEFEFIVESCSGNDCTNFVQIARLPQTQPHYTHAGLSKGKTYRYRIRSANSAGSWLTWSKSDTAYSNIASAAVR